MFFLLLFLFVFYEKVWYAFAFTPSEYLWVMYLLALLSERLSFLPVLLSRIAQAQQVCKEIIFN